MFMYILDYIFLCTVYNSIVNHFLGNLFAIKCAIYINKVEDEVEVEVRTKDHSILCFISVNLKLCGFLSLEFSCQNNVTPAHTHELSSLALFLHHSHLTLPLLATE